MNRRRASILAILGSSAAIVPGAAGSESMGEWDTNNVRMRAHGTSFPTTSPYRAALAVVERRFYDNPSDFWFTVTYDDASHGDNNDQNEVYFTTEDIGSSAVCFTWNCFSWPWEPAEICEADVAFRSDFSWTTSMSKLNLRAYGGPYDAFETAALHEFGHAAGLDHEADEYNIMGDDHNVLTCNGQVCRSYLGEDASQGLIDMYGRYAGGEIEDLSVTLFKRIGRDGEYSTHRACIVQTAEGLSVGSASFNGQRRYNVARGASYKFEFTFENNGENTQTCRAGFYLSSDSTIQTTDRRIATRTLTLARDGAAQTLKTNVRIPTDLIAGQTYYLGVIIDDLNAVGEAIEHNNSDPSLGNNAAYHIIRIVQ